MVIEHVQRWATPDRGDSRRHAPTASAATRVLVVDDDATVRRLVALVLERDGCEVTTAADGSEAIALTRRQPFDVLLLDVQMPGVDGWEVLETLCGKPRASETAACPTTAVVMSGHAAPAEALRRGASAMLRKPFSPAELLATVHHAAAAGRNGPHEAFLAPLAPLAPLSPPDALAA